MRGTVRGVTSPTDSAGSELPIRMLNDRVLVAVDGEAAERRSASGIVIPATAAVGRRLAWATVAGVAFALVCAAWGARFRGAAIALFVIQLAINLAWTPVFFALHELKLALAIILALDVAVLVTTALFWRVRRLAGWLMVPYILWILFATVLNWQFLALNPLADGANGSYAVQRIQL